MKSCGFNRSTVHTRKKQMNLVQAKLLSGEEADCRFVNNVCKLMRENNFQGFRTKAEQEELLERQQTTGDTPQEPDENKLSVHFAWKLDGMDYECHSNTARDYIKLIQTNFILMKGELWVDLL